MLTLRQICLVAIDLQSAIEDLTTVLGLNACYVDPDVEIFGVENTLIAIDTNFIEVVAPVKGDTAAGRYLKRRDGDGGYMVITQAGSAEEQKACRSRAEQIGIRVAWEIPIENGHYMQLHPADTGGCFLEIDWHESNDHQGDWPPAGGTSWNSLVKTDVVSTLKAVELQSPDPETLSKRWGAILGITPQTDDAGRIELSLSNASIRFVKDTDERGEGLGALDIHAADPLRLLQVASDRGLKKSDTQVMLCGVRFNLV
jgi:hypothetical protein